MSEILRVFLLTLFALVMPCTVSAQVIEISDDGEARVIGASSFGSPVATAARSQGDPFENAAKRYGLDVDLLRAVAWTESRGQNDAVSVKGARGIMQLMPGTAAELGVDPRDPVANIHGGAAYLARQIATFGQVPLALAAYNAGPGAVLRSGGIPRYAETQNYVATIIKRWSGIAPEAASASVQALAAHPAKRPEPRPQPIFMIEVASP